MSIRESREEEEIVKVMLGGSVEDVKTFLGAQ
jgi:hypothetical protein